MFRKKDIKPVAANDRGVIIFKLLAKSKLLIMGLVILGFRQFLPVVIYLILIILNPS